MNKFFTKTLAALVIGASLLTGNTMVSNASQQDSTSTHYVTSSNPPSPYYQGWVRCTGDYVNIRSGPGYNYPVIGTAMTNDTFVIYRSENGFARTYIPGNWCGQEAFISLSYLTPIEQPMY